MVTPETLTDEMVRLELALCASEINVLPEFDAGRSAGWRIWHDCGDWLRCEPMPIVAVQRICDAINARAKETK